MTWFFTKDSVYEGVPWWMHLAFAVSEFFFQTFDAVDGKHARRLQTSSPLGDFLDHVMDSVSIMTTGFLLVLSLHIESVACAYVALVCMSLNFVIIHWESARIKVMHLDNGSSITEAQLAFTALFLLSALAGRGLWTWAPAAPQVTLGRAVACGLICAITGMQCIKSARRVSSACGWRVFAELLVPVAYTALVAALWLARFPAGHSVVPFEMFLLAITVNFSSAITVDRLAAQPLSSKTHLVIVLPALILPLLSANIAVAWALGLFSLAYSVYFVGGMIVDIAHRLNVPIFTNPKKHI